MPEPEPNLQEIHDVLFDIALEAGDMITSANPSSVDTKKNCSSTQPLLSTSSLSIMKQPERIQH